jgi:hypothetical protein
MLRRAGVAAGAAAILYLMIGAGVQAHAATTLPSGQTLASDLNSIESGAVRFTLQKDCNLVAYQGTRPVWASGTKGSGCVAIMQGDGNLVVLGGDNGGKVVWASGTQHHPGAYLVAQSDGNVVIYPPGPQTSARALWSTNTALSPGGVPFLHPARPRPVQHDVSDTTGGWTLEKCKTRMMCTSFEDMTVDNGGCGCRLKERD